MEEIIKELTIYKMDIDADISTTFHDFTQHERMEFTRQSSQLAMAIGLLQNIGENKNIKK